LVGRILGQPANRLVVPRSRLLALAEARVDLGEQEAVVAGAPRRRRQRPFEVAVSGLPFAPKVMGRSELCPAIDPFRGQAQAQFFLQNGLRLCRDRKAEAADVVNGVAGLVTLLQHEGQHSTLGNP